MLGFFSKRKEEKTRLKIEQLLEEGLTKISHRLYNQGMINFNNAIALNSEMVGEMLAKSFNQFYSRADWDSGLSIGSVLLQIRNNDAELTNKVGNCARRTGDYKQANNLYRIALRINKKYREAFYNLAASMGKVQKYDLDVKHVITKYISFTQFILPDYAESSNYIDNIKQEIIDSWKEQPEDEEQLEERKSEEPTYDEIIVHIDQKILQLSKKLASRIALIAYHNAMYNQALYALSNQDDQLAMSRLNELKSVSSKFEYYEMLRALSHAIAEDYSKATDSLIQLLGKDRHNRFYNVNLGLIYQKSGNYNSDRSNCYRSI